MRRGFALIIAVALIAGACDLLPDPRGGFVFPTPAPLPEGAVAVEIDVAAVPERVDVGVDAFGCPAALLLPVEMVVDRSATPPTISYRSVATGQPIQIEWSWGVSAYELDGVIQVVAPNGDVLMTEGEVADDLGGGAGNAADTFSVCVNSSLPRRD